MCYTAPYGYGMISAGLCGWKPYWNDSVCVILLDIKNSSFFLHVYKALVVFCKISHIFHHCLQHKRDFLWEMEKTVK